MPSCKLQAPAAPDALARLRAAANLIPIIESGLAQSRIDAERAALMCEFCGWTTNHQLPDSEEVRQLTAVINAGLERLNDRLE